MDASLLSEIKRLKSELLRANEQIFVLQEENENLRSIASHDVQNTLSVIIHLSETLLQKESGTLSEYQQKLGNFIHCASVEMMATIKNYLTMCRPGDV